MQNTVPANYFVSVVPSVLAASGQGLDLVSLFLTNNTRVPIGTVPSFNSATSVGTYFGTSSAEYTAAQIYFAGFDGSNIKPAQVLFAQYNQTGVAAYVRGGSVGSQLTLAQLQALSGTVSVTINGVVKTSSTVNLNAATSFSNAAALILAGFANQFDAVTAATSTIAAGTATNCTVGSISGNVFTASGVLTGGFVVGGVLAGTGVTAGTTILSQVTGPAGGLGTYLVSAVQNVSSTAITQTYGLLTVVTMTTGAFAVGQVISGGTTLAGSTITAFGTGTGQAGTYIVSGGSQTVTATIISGGQMAVTFDAVANAFVIAGGTAGSAGTIGYVSGTLAASLLMTLATGAVLSQGAVAASPATFMSSVIAITTNWASFTTLFNPDTTGNANKLAFATWNNTQPSDYVYVCGDTDVTPTLSYPATTCLGYLLKQASINGTCLVYDPAATGIAYFVCGLIAAIDFTQTNGNVNPTYSTQSGVLATVTNQQVLSYLQQNGYNCVVASSTANQQFTFFWNGQISGPWMWLQPYINQIWLNSTFQTNLMQLMVSSKSIPYNNTGYGMIHAALQGTINQAVTFGAIQSGIPLATLQASEVNNAAGIAIDQVLSTRGWYLQILPATPTARQNRTTPPCNFWYTDGGSVQNITLNSIDLL